MAEQSKTFCGQREEPCPGCGPSGPGPETACSVYPFFPHSLRTTLCDHHLLPTSGKTESLRPRIERCRNLVLSGHPGDQATASDRLEIMDFMVDLLGMIDNIRAEIEGLKVSRREEGDGKQED